MVRIITSVVLSMVVLFFITEKGRSAEPKVIPKELKHKWRLIEEDNVGRTIKYSEDDHKKGEADTLIIDDNTVSWLHDGTWSKMSATIVKTKEFFEFDFEAQKGKYNHAILRLNDDNMYLCVSNKCRPNSPKDRPRDFSTKNGNSDINKDLDGLILYTFTKIK